MVTIKKIYDILTPRDRKQFFYLLILHFVMAIMDVLGVASILSFMALVANPGIVESNYVLSSIYNWMNFNSQDSFLLFSGFVVFFILLLSLSVKAFHGYMHFKYVLMWEASVSSVMIKQYLQQPYAWFLKRNSAELAKSVLSEVNAVVFGCILPVVYIISHGLATLAIVFFLYFFDPELTLVVTVTLSATFLFLYQITRNPLFRLGKERVSANQERFVSVSEAFGAIKEIKISALETLYLTRFKAAARVFADNTATSQVIGQLPRYGLEALGFGGIILMIVYLLGQSGGLATTLPIISLYALAGYRLMPAIQSIYGSVTQLRFTQPALTALHAEIVSSQIKHYQNAKVNKIKFKDKITLSTVRFNYFDEQKSSLTDINLDIKAKSRVGIVGATGSGKSTLVDIILGLLEPNQGSLLVDNQLISKQNLRQWQKSLGYVPQEIYLSDSSVAENIAFGVEAKEIDQGKLIKAASMANINDFISNELPDGYATNVGERGARLSGGERQRIGIARALYRQPELLILDEATSALDVITEAEVIDSIHKMKRETTVILIAHRLSTVRDCDIIYLLEKGKIIDRGSFKELSISSRIFQKMIRQQ